MITLYYEATKHIKHAKKVKGDYFKIRNEVCFWSVYKYLIFFGKFHVTRLIDILFNRKNFFVFIQCPNIPGSVLQIHEELMKEHAVESRLAG